jgi:fucose 4-O-acetylase-like acetyltransferase
MPKILKNTSSLPKIRIPWIDVYKALAIIFVVIGHSGASLTPYVYEFHMAAFLWIAGYTSKFDLQTPLGELFLAKWKRLMIPYFAFVSSYSLLLFLLRSVNKDQLFFGETVPLIFQPIWHFNSIVSFNYTNPLAGASWFLIVLFEISFFGVFAYSLLKKLKLPDWSIWLGSVAACYFFMIRIWPQWPGSQMSYLADLLPLCWIFYFSGFLTKKYQLLQFLSPRITLILSSFLLWFFVAILPVRINFPDRTFEPGLAVLTAGLNGSLWLWSISHYLSKIESATKPLLYLGRRTLAVLLGHFLGFKITSLFLIAVKLIPIAQLAQLTPPANSPHWWLYVLGGVLVSLCLDWLLRKNYQTKKIYLGEN